MFLSALSKSRRSWEQGASILGQVDTEATVHMVAEDR